jgi:hypothetical protein
MSGETAIIRGFVHSRVGGRRCRSDAPSGRVRDEDGGGTREAHGEQQERTTFSRAARRKARQLPIHRCPLHPPPPRALPPTHAANSQVQVQVLRTPILNDDRGDDEHGDAQQVVVKHRVPVLEPGHLDPLSHGEHIGGREETVQPHPQVADVEVGEQGTGRTDEGQLGTRRRVEGSSVLGDHGVVNVGPGGDDGRTDHEEERDEGKTGDVSAEPDDLAVCDQDDGQVLEDGVDGDREELLQASNAKD